MLQKTASSESAARNLRPYHTRALASETAPEVEKLGERRWPAKHWRGVANATCLCLASSILHPTTSAFDQFLHADSSSLYSHSRALDVCFPSLSAHLLIH